jgi:hypothetical protein
MRVLCVALFVVITVPAFSQDVTTTLRLSKQQMLYIGALVDKESCTVRQITDGTCEALDIHNEVQSQISQQIRDAQGRAQAQQQSAIDKMINEKADAKIKADAEKAKKEESPPQ